MSSRVERVRNLLLNAGIDNAALAKDIVVEVEMAIYKDMAIERENTGFNPRVPTFAAGWEHSYKMMRRVVRRTPSQWSALLRG